MINPVHLLSNNNRLHTHIGYPVLQTIKLEQVKQKSLLKFLNISPVQKKQQQQHTFSVRKSRQDVLSKAKFLLQKRTVKDYKWHPFLGLCGRVNQSRKKKFYLVLIAAITWKHISSNSRLIATAKLPEICRQDCRSLEIWRIISVVGM